MITKISLLLCWIQSINRFFIHPVWYNSFCFVTLLLLLLCQLNSSWIVLVLCVLGVYAWVACCIIFPVFSVVEARVGRGSQEAGGGTNVRAGSCRGHEEPEHCTDNPHRQPSKLCPHGYTVSQKTRPVRLIWQHFATFTLNCLQQKFIDWLRASCMVSITTVATWHTWNGGLCF